MRYVRNLALCWYDQPSYGLLLIWFYSIFMHIMLYGRLNFVPLWIESDDAFSILSTVKISIIGWWACQSKASPIILIRQMFVSDTYGLKSWFDSKGLSKRFWTLGIKLIDLHEMFFYQPRITSDVISEVFAYLNNLVRAVMPKLTWIRWNMDLGNTILLGHL